MSINELFETRENIGTGATRGLPGTAELTALSNQIAADIIKYMEENIDEYRERLQASSKDNKVLDELIDTIEPLSEVDADFLLELDEATIDGMLKSQQSKRSRARSKTMTLDNYRALMSAAVAENLIREKTGRTKTAGGVRSSYAELTPEKLEELAADQQQLRKEIRNIQSKKSIMKSKADFDESSETWQQLLKTEQMLKDLRVGGRPAEIVEVDTTKNELQEMLAGVDTEHLKAGDSKELLAKIAEMIK